MMYILRKSVLLLTYILCVSIAYSEDAPYSDLLSPGWQQTRKKNYDSHVCRLKFDWEANDHDKNKAARAWQIISQANKDSRRTKRKLHVFYYSFSDEPPKNDFRERLDRILKNIQLYYSDQMKANGFPPLTFPLDLDENGKLIVNFVPIDKPIRGMTAVQIHRLTNESAKKVLKQKDIEIHEAHVLHICHDVLIKNLVVGAGGPEGGQAWNCDIEGLDPLKFSSTQYYGGYYKTSEGNNASIYIGTMAHELGHAFSLVHTDMPLEYKDTERSLMADGNYTYGNQIRKEGNGSSLAPANALALASQSIFNGMEVEKSTREIKNTFDHITVLPLKNGGLVKGQINIEPPSKSHKCYAVIAHINPGGGLDYDSIAVSDVPDAEGNFSLPVIKKGYEGYVTLTITAHFTNGSHNSIRAHVWLRDEGIMDMNLISKTCFSKVHGLWLKGALESANKELNKITSSEKVSAIVKRVGFHWEKALNFQYPQWKYKASDLPETETMVSLVDCTPEEYKNGFGIVCWDTLFPSELGAIPAFYEGIPGRYIMLHAPASITYKLDSKWKEITMFSGVPLGRKGTVRVQIIGDGRELYHSEVIKEGHTAHINVNLEGTNTLHIRISDAGDGNTADWTILGNPVLHR